MKNLLSILVLVMMLKQGNAQQNLVARGSGGCATDCFFTDCMVKCATVTTPKCYCILGSFGSCKCVDMLGNLASGGYGSDVLPGLKNEAKLQKLIRFVRVKGYTNFLNQFITLRDALKGFDLDSYNRCYQDLFDQVEKSPVEATEIYNYVNSFR